MKGLNAIRRQIEKVIDERDVGHAKFVLVQELPDDPDNILWNDKIMNRKKARKRAKKKKYTVMWIKIRPDDYNGYKQLE